MSVLRAVAQAYKYLETNVFVTKTAFSSKYLKFRYDRSEIPEDRPVRSGTLPVRTGTYTVSHHFAAHISQLLHLHITKSELFFFKKSKLSTMNFDEDFFCCDDEIDDENTEKYVHHRFQGPCVACACLGPSSMALSMRLNDGRLATYAVL